MPQMEKCHMEKCHRFVELNGKMPQMEKCHKWKNATLNNATNFYYLVEKCHKWKNATERILLGNRAVKNSLLFKTTLYIFTIKFRRRRLDECKFYTVVLGLGKFMRQVISIKKLLLHSIEIKAQIYRTRCKMALKTNIFL